MCTRNATLTQMKLPIPATMEASPIVALSKTTPQQKDTVGSTRTRRFNQKAQKRRETLLRKAFEYYTKCDADINLVVRMRKTG